MKTNYFKISILLAFTALTFFPFISSAQLYVASSKVGIGISTPTNILSLVNTTAQKIWIENTASGTIGRDLTVAAGSTVGGTNITGGSNIIQAGVGTGTGASTISFQNGTTLGSGSTLQTMSTKMTILGSGKVGIGTNAPASLLHLYSTAGSGTYTQIIEDGNADGGLKIGTQSASAALQSYRISTSGVDKLLLNPSGGNVGVGTTTPGYKLQVGNAGDGTEARANAWNNLSDSSSKTNVVTIHNSLKKVLHLRGVTFNWILSGKPSIGFIAQEVESVLPTIVSTDTITGLKSLDYGKIVPVIVECIKQLDSTNTALAEKDSIKDAKIQELETKDSILNLKSQNQDSIIASLQNQLNALASTINSCCEDNQDNGNHNGHYKADNNQTNVELNEAQTIVLEQNVPNPFAEQTAINYSLPDNTVKAQMLFYNAQGKLIQSTELTQKGKGTLNVFASDLSNGIYTYTLVVDGRIIETRKMVKQ